MEYITTSINKPLKAKAFPHYPSPVSIFSCAPHFFSILVIGVSVVFFCFSVNMPVPLMALHFLELSNHYPFYDFFGGAFSSLQLQILQDRMGNTAVSIRSPKDIPFPDSNGRSDSFCSCFIG